MKEEMAVTGTPHPRHLLVPETEMLRRGKRNKIEPRDHQDRGSVFYSAILKSNGKWKIRT